MRLLPLVVLVLIGCGPATQGIRLTPPAATSGEPPILLFSATQPRCPFQDVGIITSQPQDFTSEPLVLEGLRREARRLGGDAVVHVRFVGEGILSGTVVRFTSADCKE